MIYEPRKRTYDQLHTYIDRIDNFDNNFTKQIIMTARQEYERKRDEIRYMQGISEKRRNSLHFNNWMNYITNSTPVTEEEKVRTSLHY